MRKRSERIEGERERNDARKADEPIGGFQSRETAKRCRNANRSSRVGTDGSRREARRHRDRGAAARASRDAMHARVPRIPRRAHRLVAAPAAERELHHVGLAERDHTGGEQTLDRRSGFRRDASPPRFRAGGGRAAFDVQQILERDRQAVQRTAR
jgi:hypothetical protein